ncbi:hypothetical protein [Streptomyces sp. MK7]|uniref:hypothetical protein n=1 Tax=Streptomyces sp. MK7 TaxID=3067635 RepID=UPI00292E4A9A|nr:hypothetical protein [Streptomyces sp. MK7]
MQLVLAVMEHAEEPPEGPWTADLSQAAVVDGQGAVWFVGDGDVGRLVPLSCACEHVEYTTYCNGVEISRTVSSTS